MSKRFLAPYFLICGLLLGFTACSSDDSEDPIVEDNNRTVEPGEEEETIKEGTFNFKTFKDVKVGFGDGLSQSAEGTFSFPTDIEKVKTIKMYVQNPCPNKECDEWDRFANIYVKNKSTNEWYEIGRFITPYWVGSEKLERGWEFDVTDFKSLLTGDAEIKIYTETWLAKGRVYSVDFDFIYGKTAYKYSAVTPLYQYNQSSIDGVPYGTATTTDLSREIAFPKNVDLAYFRTTISGWGHATPNDAGGRACAEWCYRTHHIQLDGTNAFEHYMGPIGCADNPINNQAPGNWKPDRAGWCPGMVVTPYINQLSGDVKNKTVKFNYALEPWTANNPENKAYYAISTYIVVHSNTPISAAIVN
ncbi:peptidase [Myroides sp. NP-2]|uniref:peptide-N-glycosidase F-related protein n=1 Tax=Myroides sp. NP-2 TaxID=2759945 RepID=UPI0015FAF39E|nr:peptide-N-glycosidase F-related protein [Myroides sp. NP-2]MBB1149842.1 peptidase [Myroides sp. NP-2]